MQKVGFLITRTIFTRVLLSNGQYFFTYSSPHVFRKRQQVGEALDLVDTKTTFQHPTTSGFSLKESRKGNCLSKGVF